MGKLTNDDLEFVGIEESELDEKELIIPEYECDKDSILEMLERTSGKGRWYMNALMHNVFNRCIIAGDNKDLEDLNITEGDIGGDSDFTEVETVKKPKKKRAMSGYNCYTKIQTKKHGKSFQEVLQEKGWSKLSDKEKEEYNKMAKEGCEV